MPVRVSHTEWLVIKKNCVTMQSEGFAQRNQIGLLCVRGYEHAHMQWVQNKLAVK